MLTLLLILSGVDPATIGRPIERPGAVINNPSWIRRPEPEMPPLALILGLTGSVSLVCTSNTDGALTNCETQSDPPGLGFEEAALAATVDARLRPRTVDGVRSMASVSFTVSFFPEELLPLPRYAGREPDSGLVEFLTAAWAGATYVDAFGDLVVSRLSPEQRVQLVPILRAAFVENRRAWIDAQALAIARNLPPETLSQLRAGIYPREPETWDESAFDQVRAVEIRIYARARELYCASYDCPWA